MSVDRTPSRRVPRAAVLVLALVAVAGALAWGSISGASADDDALDVAGTRSRIRALAAVQGARAASASTASTPASASPALAADRAVFPELSPEAAAAWGVKPPPAPAPAAAPAAPPLAPVFPYKFVGVMQDDPQVSAAAADPPATASEVATGARAGSTAILWAGEQTLFVHSGDTLDGTWLIGPIGAHVLSVTHVPSNTTLPVSEKIQ